MNTVHTDNLHQFTEGVLLLLSFNLGTVSPLTLDDTFEVTIIRPDGTFLHKTEEDVTLPDITRSEVLVPIVGTELSRKGVYTYQVTKTTGNEAIKSEVSTFEVNASLPIGVISAPIVNPNQNFFVLIGSQGQLEVSPLMYDPDTGQLLLNGNILGTSGSDLTPPTMITFSATAQGENQINIAYNATDNIAVTGYDLEWSPNGTSGWTALLTDSDAASPYQHTGRIPATQYFYRGRARDGSDNTSSWSTSNATTQASGDVSPTIVTTSVPNGTVGQAYPNTQIAVASGNAPITFELTSGDLPAGMDFSSLGVLSGTPIEEGTSSFGIRASDADGDFDEQSFDLTVSASPVGDTPIYNQLSATAKSGMRRMYSVRKVRDEYTGYALRVVNIDTNVETDIPFGFSKADIDLLGTVDKMRLARWYDQSGNGNDFVFTLSEKPRLEYLNRPMLDFSKLTSSGRADVNLGSLTLTAPKIFYAIDGRVGSRSILNFYNISSNTFKFIDTFDGQRFNQGGSVTVSYDPMQARGTSQISSLYQVGDEVARQNGVELVKYSEATNTGDTGLTANLGFLGDIGGSGLIFVGRIGEILLFDGDIPEADRNLIEVNQQSYFMNGKRLVTHGDSLMYGANLFDIYFNAKQDDWAVGAQTRDLLGEGWDVYQRGISGSSLNNISGGDFNQIVSAPSRIDTLYKPTADDNVLIFWTGWNDFNGGETVESFKSALQTYVAARRAVGWKVVVMSLPIANYSGQSAGYPAARLAVNSWLRSNWHNFADAYADFADDPIIGNNADTSNTTYWKDQLHMQKAGYEIVATYVRDAIQSIA